ncbi:cation:proton antiporter [Sphingomonas sp.]|jgi:NhaP-type Na+/H+ or K+/H+ antiporter|uniref:cation:proton antiporter n=1 Tax=Sphingomonas sp. TaxID=28214 RepID=UPI002DF33371|nr:cation:proton antiporter [Sphingomonas sp.]HEV2567388.1 cation:proton antiporter [Sphingomonas sp.]
MPDAAAFDIVRFYIPILLGLGGLILLVAWLPLVVRKLPLSLPILCVGIGMAVFSWTIFADYAPHPAKTPVLVEKAAELIVIVSLMGAGLKIERPFGWQSWSLTWRLIAIAMPLTIIALTVAGQTVLGLGLATALVLAASLAPTDPVLASDIQIEHPRSNQDDETRFALTSEAGLNDAAAFPFVHLAIALSVAGLSSATLSDWAIDSLLVKVAVGTVSGLALGWAFGWIIYQFPRGTRLSRTGDGFVALGATLSIYALTELLHGYGFLAVFLAGLMLRRSARGHDYNDRMHDFADEVERLLMMALLVFFGGMLVAGGLLANLGWREVAFAALTIFIVRPLVGWISLAGSGRSGLERFVISFFGIRGLGSVYYLAYAINHGRFEQEVSLWSTLGLVILVSILLHGVTVTPFMRRLDEATEGEVEKRDAPA